MELEVLTARVGIQCDDDDDTEEEGGDIVVHSG